MWIWGGTGNYWVNYVHRFRYTCTSHILLLVWRRWGLLNSWSHSPDVMPNSLASYQYPYMSCLSSCLSISLTVYLSTHLCLDKYLDINMMCVIHNVWKWCQGRQGPACQEMYDHPSLGIIPCRKQSGANYRDEKLCPRALPTTCAYEWSSPSTAAFIILCIVFISLVLAMVDLNCPHPFNVFCLMLHTHTKKKASQSLVQNAIIRNTLTLSL